MQRYRVTEVHPVFTTSRQRIVLSLEELCANKLVSYGVLLPSFCLQLPQQFLKIFIRSAITLGSRTSIAALLNAWRQETYIFEMPDYLRRLKTYVFHDISTFFCRCANGEEYAPFVVQCVMHLLSLDVNRCQIRCLDFSSFPVEGCYQRPIYKLLIEKRSMFPRCEDGSAMKTGCPEEQNSLIKFVVKINAVVNYMDDIRSLCHTLSCLKNSNTALNLQVTGIHQRQNGILCESILKLLHLIEPDALDSFSCSLFFVYGFEECSFNIMQKLKSFPNLRTLNFQMTTSEIEYFDRFVLELNGLFRQLKTVRHFNLKFFHLETPYETFDFPVIQNGAPEQPFLIGQLESLTLTGYRIPADEFKYPSPFPQALNTMTLNDCKVDLHSFIRLLKLCRNLQGLYLTDCEFSGGYIFPLFQTIAVMEKMEYLIIKDMSTVSEDLVSKDKLITYLPDRKCVSNSAVREEWENDCYNCEMRFYHTVEKLLQNSRSRNSTR